MEDRDSNIGQVGVESIRIKGKRIEDLPLGQGNEAVVGLAEARETERLNAINTINATYPKHRVDYLASRIVECQENITRINTSKGQQSGMISDYKGHIALCRHRDREMNSLLAMLDDGGISEDGFLEQKKELHRKFPLFNVAAMEQQIVQCNEALVRCDDVIQQEHDSIAEFTDVMAQCRIRDTELAKHGAVAEGS